MKYLKALKLRYLEEKKNFPAQRSNNETTNHRENFSRRHHISCYTLVIASIVCLCACVCVFVVPDHFLVPFPSTFPLTLTDQVFCSCFFYLFERDTSKSISLHHHVSNCFRSVLDVLPIGTHHHHPSVRLRSRALHLSLIAIYRFGSLLEKFFNKNRNTHTHTSSRLHYS